MAQCAFGGEREHEAGEAAEDHADADQGSDHPDGARRPGAPDHDGEDQGNDAVDKKPVGSVAEFFEEDVQTNLTAAMSLIEPAILIVMGVVVVTILIALYLPIFSLSAGGAGGQ